MHRRNWWTESFDEDILDELLLSQSELSPPDSVSLTMRDNLLANIAQDLQGKASGFHTIRENQGQWEQLAPGADIKILSTDGELAAATYIVRLQPGFRWPGHTHAIVEENLILEGELHIGNICLQQGDYHRVEAHRKHGETFTHTGAVVLVRGALPHS